MGSGEPFELVELLGVGGFAHTYRARIVDEGYRQDFGEEEVAVKIPLNREKERLLQHELEMNIILFRRLKELDSSHIVRYLGFAVFRNQMVMVMEYIKHGSLRRMLGSADRPKHLPAEEAARIAMGVLKGLAVIHAEHFFHRDIKPENILMDGTTPKIADLGIARMLHSNELASTTTGTIYYMSPEILGEEGACFLSDLWSVGVTLYEMLAGRLPFGDFRTPIGTMVDLIRRQEPVPLRQICDDVPEVLSDIVDRALARDGNQRYQSAQEMHDALKAFLEGPTDEIEREVMALRESWSRRAPDEVEARLGELIARYPRDPRLYQCLGEFYNLCQRYPEAIRAFKKGLLLDRDSGALHWYLALAYHKIGERAAAARHLEKAMGMDLDASLRRHAGNLLRALRGTV